MEHYLTLKVEALARLSKLKTYHSVNNPRKKSIISTSLLFNRFHVILIYHPAEFKDVLTSLSFQHSEDPCMYENNGTNWYLQIKAFCKYTRSNVEQPVKWMMRSTVAVLEVGILHISYKTLALCKFITY